MTEKDWSQTLCECGHVAAAHNSGPSRAECDIDRDTWTPCDCDGFRPKKGGDSDDLETLR